MKVSGSKRAANVFVSQACATQPEVQYFRTSTDSFRSSVIEQFQLEIN